MDFHCMLAGKVHTLNNPPVQVEHVDHVNCVQQVDQVEQVADGTTCCSCPGGLLDLQQVGAGAVQHIRSVRAQCVVSAAGHVLLQAFHVTHQKQHAAVLWYMLQVIHRRELTMVRHGHVPAAWPGLTNLPPC
jgi:hypothetical protein